LILLAVSLLALVAPAWVGAQAESGEELRYRLRTRVDLVLVPVTVKDGAGNLVTDLNREDFRLFEDGEPQPIRHFSIDPFPLSAVILFDAGLEAKDYPAVQESLSTFASAFGPHDEFSLYVFDTYPRRVLDFTRDPGLLAQAVRSLARAPSGLPSSAGGAPGGPMTAGPRINTIPVEPGTSLNPPTAPQSVKAINDALFAAALALRPAEPGRRRAIFIVSDGRNSRLNLHPFEETRDLLLTEDVAVYAIGVGSARFALGTTVLSDYAAATGGDFYAPLKKETLARAYLRVVEQTRYQYTLVYAAPPAPATRTYRRIKVEVNRPGVEVRARQGYFAGAPEH
jgi:VWFA-related protein